MHEFAWQREKHSLQKMISTYCALHLKSGVCQYDEGHMGQKSNEEEKLEVNV